MLLEKGSKKKQKCEEHPGQVPKRPKSIPADIVRFKNGTEDWIAFVGLQDGRPYEVFTGKIEEDAMYIPRKIDKGYIIKVREEDGTKRYDFQYTCLLYTSLDLGCDTLVHLSGTTLPRRYGSANMP